MAETLKVGVRGDTVREVQRALSASGAELEPDGNFGPKTEVALKAFQTAKGLPATGVVDQCTAAELVTVLAAKPAPAAAAPVARGGELISAAALDLIIREEVSSQSEYERKYRRPIWPALQSGVTVGIGYDCGHNSPAQIAEDWSGLIEPAMIRALQSVSGVKGSPAQAKAKAIRDLVDVPWDAAIDVFKKTSVPKYAAMARKALPNFDSLSPDCRGAITSLVYNRGPSFSLDGERYREMRNIRAHMVARAFDQIPAEFRAMKRIWAGNPQAKGVVARRDREAALFEKGLRA